MPLGTCKMDRSVVDALRRFEHASKFRRACLSVMAWSLTHEERKSVVDAFLELDTSRRGTIRLHELRDVLSGFDIPDQEAAEIFHALDSGHCDEVHYSEFLGAMVSSRIAMHDQMLRAVFARFDVDGKGYISRDSLLKLLGESEGDVDELLKEVDPKETGKVFYEQFVAYLRSGNAQDLEKERVASVTLIPRQDLEKERVASAELAVQSGQSQVEVQTAQQALEAQLQHTKQTLEELERERQKRRQLEAKLASMKQTLQELEQVRTNSSQLETHRDQLEVQLQSSKKALEDLEKDKIAAAQLRAQSGQLQVEVQTAQQALEAQLQNTKQTLEELEMERQKSRQLEAWFASSVALCLDWVSFGQVQLESMKQALEEQDLKRVCKESKAWMRNTREHASARDQGKRCKEALEAVERKQSELLAEKEKEQTQAECRIAELLDKVKELEGSSMADEEKILEPSVR
ncbi:unnamed protein product, partial [Durusdinium trenchii]